MDGIMSNSSMSIAPENPRKFPMKPDSLKQATPTFAERIGRMLGRAWRSVLRLEGKAGEWLTAQGLPSIVAQALPLLFRFAVLGVALYAAFWLALMLVFLIVAAEVARNYDWSWMREPEWRDGPAGFGLYTSDDFRIDTYAHDDD
jgi:hypothetical protein